jgi:hypothetical protein
MEWTPTRADVWLRKGSRGQRRHCDWRTDDHDDVLAGWIVSFYYRDGSDNALAFCVDCLARVRELYPEVEA